SHSPGRRLSGEKHAPETAARATDDETLRNTGIIPDPAVVEQESAIRNHGNRECTCARAKIDLADLHVIRWRNTRDIRDAKDRDICNAVWHPRRRPIRGGAPITTSRIEIPSGAAGVGVCGDNESSQDGDDSFEVAV